jgi:D-glycero-D-manno-heptose 1,7-bisphosphate phosphatase
MAKAVFLDRDGTIVADPGYLHKPEDVQLLPGAAEGIRRLNAGGYLVVVVTNQSGIARGLYSVRDYHAVERRLDELLAQEGGGGGGAHIDASYFCPHHPQAPEPCECRKPRTKLFREAQAALDIDFTKSWWVGDRLTDVQPARILGGRAILVATGQGNLHQGQARAIGVTVVADLRTAAGEIVRLPTLMR